MKPTDVAIAGAGLVGAALALELAARGLRVTLLSAGEPLAQASTAAAGMLAVDDPENPPALHALATLSRALYPGFLAGLAEQTGVAPVRFQTTQTLQAISPAHALPTGHNLTTAQAQHLLPQLAHAQQRFALLEEASVDPRELATAVRAALDASSRITLERATPVQTVSASSTAVRLATPHGTVEAAHLLDCTGAWTSLSSPASLLPVSPRKGQLFTVALPSALPLRVVLRPPAIYIVPRLHGPQVGRAVIGATVEDRGFNTEVEPATIAALHARAATLLPPLAEAPVVETWAGLRPATADGLPLLGRTGERTWISKAHFRNGILLAPASARVLTQLLLDEPLDVDIAPFSPTRQPVA